MTIPKVSKGELPLAKRIWTGMGEAQRLHLAHLVLALEGRQVSIALVDGNRIDDCQLISGGRPGTPTLWLYDNGADRFVPLCEVRDVWEAAAAHPPHAA
jgi:hypothetical protein